MTNFLIIGLCLVAGMIFRRSKTLPADAHKGINAWLIYLALPAVSFKYLPHIQWSTSLLLPALAPLIVWLGGWLYIRVYAAKTNIPAKTAAGLTLSAGLSNTSFVGFPLIAAFFGEKYIAIGVICDQVTFLLLATAGITVAINASQTSSLSVITLLKKVSTFPPFLGCILALTIPHFINISPLNPLFDRLANTVGPLALFSIGLQLQFKGYKDELKRISVTLLYKLVLAPSLIAVIALIFQLRGIITQVSIFEMAMPTFLSSSIVANDYQLNPRLSNLVIGIGLIIGFATTAIWWNILQLFK
ncbi:MAG: transporter [Mucilaginibacter sp.]|nr:transporter [Mucilaginibacter sp.]